MLPSFDIRPWWRKNLTLVLAVLVFLVWMAWLVER